MSSRPERIDVYVKRRVLWVGREAYPLRNIARAQTIRLAPDRRAALGHYLTAVVGWVILGGAAAVAIRLAPRLDSVRNANILHGIAVGVLVLAVVLFALSTIRLAAIWSRRIYYALIIETAGAQHRALVSTDAGVLHKLVHEIMDAINDPEDVSFHYRIDNYADLRGAQGVLMGDSGTQRNTFNGR
jgi:hypothetical protein